LPYDVGQENDTKQVKLSNITRFPRKARPVGFSS